MKELDTVDGIGLIEKKRIGLGRTNRIYVKNFMVRGNGGMGTGTADAGQTQPHTAGNPYGAGISRKKEVVLEGPLHCAGTMPEMKADVEKENTAGTTAAAITETQEGQDQNWRVCGKSMPGNGRSGKVDDRRSREESGVYEENWWDMGEDAASSIKNSWQGMPLCKSSAGVGMDMESTVDIADTADIEDSVDNVDNCRAAGNFMDEYQNPEPETHSEEHIFADKTVEAMVREMPGEQKTGPSGGGFKCVREPQGISRQISQGSEIQDGGGQQTVIVETEMPKQRDSKRNDTEYSKTENNKTDFSAVCVSYPSYPSYQSSPARQYAQGGQQYGRHSDCRMDGTGEEIGAYRECIRENIDYQCFRPQDMESVDELVELMADTMLVPDRGTVRVAGAEKPASVVKGRFMKLVHSHIEYVIGCMQRHTGKIHNIKAYLLTALYNSSLTISSFYSAEVNHDLYGLYGCC